MPSSACLFALLVLGLASACRSDQPHEYWWEQGHSSGGRATSLPETPRPEPTPTHAPAEAAGSKGVLAVLGRTRLPGFRVQGEESLSAVVDALRTATGLPLVVDPAAETAALDAGALFDLRLSNPISARNLLDLIVEQAGPEVDWTIRHEAILVTTRAKARGRTVMQAHDIRILVAAQTDYVAPRLDRIRAIDDLEDEDGGSPFGSQEESAPRFEADDLVTLVQDNVAVGTWQDEGVSISAENGVLFVVHTPLVQARISRFLASLSGF